MQKQAATGKPDAIILAGGMMGKSKLFPKALLEHEGKSIIEHQIEWLSPFVNKIIIACHGFAYKLTINSFKVR